MSRVVLLKCENYEKENIYSVVKKGIDLLGGASRFFGQGEKILLKPNLLFGKPPEACVNTHPSFLYAMSRICRDAGAEVRYGDHPGVFTPNNAARKSGWDDAANELKVPLDEFKSGRVTLVKEPLIHGEFDIAEAIFTNDAVISLSKLKTHSFTKFTGAVKNQFGCIYNFQKKTMHMKYSDVRDFAKMLIDLNRTVRPKLFIMDAVMAMEGSGPQSGDPVRMNAVLISTDPVALDATACRMIDLDPEYVYTNLYGTRYGLGTSREEEIEILGDDLKNFINSDFNVDRSQSKAYKGSGPFSVLINLRVPKPAIDSEKCIKCGVCIEACPADPKAVNWGEQGKSATPQYNYKQCIRCYCCQEMCPEKAIYLKKAVTGKRVENGHGS